MARLVIFQTGFTGVDLKSNPLTLGEKKKLRFATNLVFEEGVVRTRPGFRYTTLAEAGQFQGACSFSPSKGISSQIFSSQESGIALVVDGTLWFNCQKVSPELYRCKGNVELFSAENYLILQNRCSYTYWWDGKNLTESPGLQEEYWNEVETPVVELEVIPPSAPDLTPCYNDGIATITFVVVNHFTEAFIDNASVVMNRNGRKAYTASTNALGEAYIKPFPRKYTYYAGAQDFIQSEELPLEVIKGVDKTVYIRLIPVLLPFNILAFLSVPYQITPGRYDLSGFFGPEIVPPKNKFRTKWRLFTDNCGYQIEYFVGDLNNNGQLLSEGEGRGDDAFAYFDTATQEFVSYYTHPEGLYLQLGVYIRGVLTWVDRPCIEGGDE